jgi:hypothetical protein
MWPGALEELDDFDDFDRLVVFLAAFLRAAGLAAVELRLRDLRAVPVEDSAFFLLAILLV